MVRFQTLLSTANRNLRHYDMDYLAAIRCRVARALILQQDAARVAHLAACLMAGPCRCSSPGGGAGAGRGARAAPHTPGCKQSTPRLLSGTFRDFQGLSMLESET